MKKAILTICRNEGVLLDIWYNYYRRFFNSEDIYILDHGSTDGSTDKYNCEKIEHEFTCDNKWLQDTVSTKHFNLLKDYEYVTVADVDEIIAHRKMPLDKYIECIGIQEYDYVRCVGYDVLQLMNEKPLDFKAPLLSQRTSWYRLNYFFKPCISCIPQGYMRDEKDRANVDTDLIMIHLHRIDYDRCYNRMCAFRGEKWNDTDLQTTSGWQHRLKTKQDFDKFFYSLHKADGPLEEIPIGIKRLI